MEDGGEVLPLEPQKLRLTIPWTDFAPCRPIFLWGQRVSPFWGPTVQKRRRTAKRRQTEQTT